MRMPEVSDVTFSVSGAQDLAGNAVTPLVDESTDVVTVLDMATPDAPTIDGVTTTTALGDEDGILNDATPIVAISAEAGSTVNVFVDGVLVGTAVETATPGSFTFEDVDLLADGTYSITATSTDAAGNVSDPSAGVSVEIDLTSPEVYQFSFDGHTTTVTAAGDVATGGLSEIDDEATGEGTDQILITWRSVVRRFARGAKPYCDRSLDVADVDVGGNFGPNVVAADVLTPVAVSNATATITNGGNAVVLSAADQLIVDALAASSNITFGASASADDATPQIGFTYAATQDLDFLSAGDTLSITYMMSVSDGTESADAVPVVIEITGTNDAPVLSLSGMGDSASGTVTEPGIVGPNMAISGTLTASGSISVSDVDNAHSEANDTWSVDGMGAGTYGTLTVSQQGVWTYTLDPSAAQILDEGDTPTEIFTVRVVDAFGAADTQTVSILVNGTNDAPELTVVTASGTVTEAGAAASGTAVASVNGSPVTTTVANGTPSQASGIYGDLSLNSSGAWEYQLNNTAADVLDVEDSSVQETFKIRVADNQGGYSEEVVTVTIVGSNDGPVANADSGATDQNTAILLDVLANDTDIDADDGSCEFHIGFLGATDADERTISETDGSLFTSGTLTVSDLDTSNEVTVSSSYAGAIGNVRNLNAAQLDGISTAGATFDYLQAGESLTLAYTVVANDGVGNSAPQTVSVTIDGTNDAAILTSYSSSGTITEQIVPPLIMGPGIMAAGLVLSSSGSFNFTDVDHLDTHTISASMTSTSRDMGTGAELGTLTPQLNADSTGSLIGQASWSFEVNNDAIKFLREGEVITQTYAVVLSDGTTADDQTHTVQVTLTGTNDAPIVAVTEGESGSANLVEDSAASLTASGSLDFSDVDLADTLTSSVSLPSVSTTAGPIPMGLGVALSSALTITDLGTLTGSSGTIAWNFALDDTLTQYLAAGETVTAVYTVFVTDDSGTMTSQDSEQITVQITGTNDAPVIAASDTAGLTEDTPLVTSGTLSVSDVDTSNLVTVSANFDCCGVRDQSECADCGRFERDVQRYIGHID
ncbi:hypothetical protein GQR58_000502 [Nymphon striatum]|nr:hypothetical protein GQR58_000502 [Nymphon striatum]